VQKKGGSGKTTLCILLHDVLLIDTPPSLTMTATAAAVSAADIILIPTSPSPADIWEAAEQNCGIFRKMTLGQLVNGERKIGLP
jgi:cellulose biosynthesis protein BcsQ